MRGFGKRVGHPGRSPQAADVIKTGLESALLSKTTDLEHIRDIVEKRERGAAESSRTAQSGRRLVLSRLAGSQERRSHDRTSVVFAGPKVQDLSGWYPVWDIVKEEEASLKAYAGASGPSGTGRLLQRGGVQGFLHPAGGDTGSTGLP